MNLYVVSDTINGYAREDSVSSRVIGVYTDPKVAELVKKGAGTGASVSELKLDHIPLGIFNYLKELGFKHPVLNNVEFDGEDSFGL